MVCRTQVGSTLTLHSGDPEHLDPAHHRVMLDLVRGCQVVVAAHMGPAMVASPTHLGIQVLGAPTESVDGALGAYLRSLAGGPPLEAASLAPNTAKGRQSKRRCDSSEERQNKGEL
jgi:dinitrogenase iron-molybdenum cofactor